MNSSTDQWFESWRNLVSNQPWQSTLEDWWRHFSGDAGAASSPVFEKIAAQSHSFFQLAQELSKLDPGEAGNADWHTRMDEMFEELKRSLENTSQNQARNLFWQMPLANWLSTASSLSGFPGTPLSGAFGGASIDPGSKIKELLNAPGVGYTRESQADVQKLSRLSIDYLEAQRRYSEFFIEMSKDSLDAMRRRLEARMQEGHGPVTTVREFYDLWVDCSEEVYRSRTMTDEYATLHGEMVNSLMALKQHSAAMMDDTTDMLNLPTRQELDTMHQRAQNERRKAKGLEREVQMLRRRESDLTRQVTELSRRFEELSRTGRGKAGGKAASRHKEAKPKGARRRTGNKPDKVKVAKGKGKKS